MDWFHRQRFCSFDDLKKFMAHFKNVEDVETYLRDQCYKACATLEYEMEDDEMCASEFVEYLCWPATKIGHIAKQNCSGDVLKSTLQGVAQRQCTENGTWVELPGNDSIYNQCGRFIANIVNVTQETKNDDLYKVWLPKIKEISYCGYALSIISLVLSLIILVNIKRLHCSRNKLHIHLFISFILRSLMAILKDSLFIRGTALRHETIIDSNGDATFSYSWMCKAIISVRYYFIISNFMLMLMEGIYLHNLMFLKLFSERHGVTLYCVLGWGLPFIFIIPWIILRVLYENLLCWTRKENIYISLFVDLPIGITVVINFILFLIIVRVLTLKLNNACIQQRKIKYRKLLKATLILIPLFGVPYLFSLIMSFYIHLSAVLEIVFLFFDQSFAAFQGLFAALMYCLLNSEVQMEIRRKYILMKDKNDKEFRRSRTISNTQQVSFQNDDTPTEENIVMYSKENNNPEIIVVKEQQCYF